MTHRRRLPLLALLPLLTACGDEPAAPPSTDAPAVFDEAWWLLDRYYAFFDAFGIDWTAARVRTGPRHDDFGPTQEVRLAPLGRRFAGPVAVLTDRDDHSATEDLVMMMRVLPTAVVVGDTTFGTSSNPRTETLATGWTLRIPQSVQTTPDGLVVEGRGLPPGIAVRLDAADVARGVDTILRAAVAELRRRLSGT